MQFLTENYINLEKLNLELNATLFIIKFKTYFNMPFYNFLQITNYFTNKEHNIPHCDINNMYPYLTKGNVLLDASII